MSHGSMCNRASGSASAWVCVLACTSTLGQCMSHTSSCYGMEHGCKNSPSLAFSGSAMDACAHVSKSVLRVLHHGSAVLL